MTLPASNAIGFDSLRHGGTQPSGDVFQEQSSATIRSQLFEKSFFDEFPGSILESGDGRVNDRHLLGRIDNCFIEQSEWKTRSDTLGLLVTARCLMQVRHCLPGEEAAIRKGIQLICSTHGYNKCRRKLENKASYTAWSRDSGRIN